MASGSRYHVDVSDEAKTDLASILGYLDESADPAAVTAFLEEFDQICARLSVNPELYQAYLFFIHRVNFKRFPYYVGYAIDSVNLIVDIVLIAHQQSNPNRLQRRINL